MLERYRMVRGKRAKDDPLPSGVRQDTRKHTRHLLRPDADEVMAYLDDPSEAAWEHFARSYRTRLVKLWKERRVAFDELAKLAWEQDVWLGCSCPTTKNPDVRRCHTFLALGFLSEHYPKLVIRWPE